MSHFLCQRNLKLPHHALLAIPVTITPQFESRQLIVNHSRRDDRHRLKRRKLIPRYHLYTSFSSRSQKNHHNVCTRTWKYSAFPYFFLLSLSHGCACAAQPNMKIASPTLESEREGINKQSLPRLYAREKRGARVSQWRLIKAAFLLLSLLHVVRYLHVFAYALNFISTSESARGA